MSIFSLAIIIPTLNEEGYLRKCLDSVAPLTANVIVVDGGSTDNTVSIARDYGATVVSSPTGRGIQMHIGASAAKDDILLFLHADTRLSAEAVTVLRQVLSTPDFSAGTFRLAFDNKGMMYRLYAFGSRIESRWTTFGDQGILIRRSLYEQLGGFPPWPLLEDVELLSRARRVSPIIALPADVVTSARRFEQNGRIRQQVRNAAIVLRYFLGANPERLAEQYRSAPFKQSNNSCDVLSVF